MTEQTTMPPEAEFCGLIVPTDDAPTSTEDDATPVEDDTTRAANDR